MAKESRPASELPSALLPGPGTESPPLRAKGRGRFPIVGIGASAGGLEAIELFLANVRSDSGMAYVVIQHLDPKHTSLMPELIRRITPMSVIQVEDRTRVRPDCVYVIPPNKDISILRGVLHLFDLSNNRGLHMSIDFFLRSLADDQAEFAAGVILSGTGTDGTLGLRAIKGREGLVLVQEPASAKFDGMPRSAIEDGLADFIAPPEELPRDIVEYFLHAVKREKSDRILDLKSQGSMEKILLLLRSHTGNDFSLYKRSTLYRRVERRMGIHRIAAIASYLRFVQENPQELDLLFKELLIGVTTFFRDAEAWEALQKLAIEGLVESKSGGQPLRVWTAGCSTGEEAYSLAIAIKEAVESTTQSAVSDIQIFATDLDRNAIDRARQGFFRRNIAADISPERLRRFFTAEDQGYRIRKDIRDMIIFAPHNLIMDPPFTKLDLVCCRNLLIYLATELQGKVLSMLHYSLKSGGHLFLGSAETIGSLTGLFSPVDARARLYRKLEAAQGSQSFDTSPERLSRPSARAKGQRLAKSDESIQSLADQVLLQRFSPAAALVDGNGDIIYISGRTGRFLEPAAGKANLNIFAMARKGLNLKLESALPKALRSPESLTVRGIDVEHEGGHSIVDLTLQSLAEPEALRGAVMIVFEERSLAAEGMASDASPDPRATGIGELELEIREAGEEIRALREGMQSSQEELRSANEELQSTNEELQSTIEELTTSKEEMQSMNEELQTVNGELQAKMDELENTSNDMKNLLNSTGIAALFLDEGLRVRRFTTQTASITKLIPGDVGRQVTDIASEFIYPELAADAAEVLRSLIAHERELLARDGNWYSARVMPYSTDENEIDGIVITYTKMTSRNRGGADSIGDTNDQTRG